VENLLCKHEANAQISDGCLVGRLEKCKHQPTTKRKNGKLQKVFKLPMDPKARTMAKQEACTTSRMNKM
jgi:hypothetical protein